MMSTYISTSVFLLETMNAGPLGLLVMYFCIVALLNLNDRLPALNITDYLNVVTG